MTVIYPLTKQLDYTELKFSLRSIEKFLKPSFEVVIVGDLVPDWITNITQIALGDIRGRKQVSIKRKILAALELVDEGFCMADDIYLLKPTSPKTWVNRYAGTLKGYPESGSQPVYKKLLELGKPVKNFDCHYPVVYRKDFKEIIPNFCDECIIKSAYCNFLEVEGLPAPDSKISDSVRSGLLKAFIQNKPCFSTGARTINAALPVLNELFPNSSRFEI